MESTHSMLNTEKIRRILLALYLTVAVVGALAVWSAQRPITPPPSTLQASQPQLSAPDTTLGDTKGYPQEVTHEPFTFAYSPLPEKLATTIKALSTPSQALNVLRALDYGYLVPDIRVSETTGIKQITYRLPGMAASNQYINLVLGQYLPTRFGEKLPEGTIAVVSQFPKDTVGALGPFLWVNTDGVTRFLYDADASTVYQSLGYPEILYGEIYVQDPFLGRTLAFRPTDRIGEFVGEEFASGGIRWGTTYLYVAKDGSWGLREYPDIPSEGDAAHLMWNFHQVNPKTGSREFSIHWALEKSQVREQEITISNPQKPQHNVGTSIIFRTDKTKWQTDIIAVAAYTYLANVKLLRDIIYNTPLPDGSLPDPNNLIVAAGDLHYVSNGKLGPLFNHSEKPKVIDRKLGRKSVTVSGVRNHTGVYIGRRAGPSSE